MTTDQAAVALPAISLKVPEIDSGSKPITVALMDNGVDFANERVAGMVRNWRSYFQWLGGFIEQFWNSSGVHGTAMAGLVRTMCPMARLFVAQLNEYTSANGRRQIYADSAARVTIMRNLLHLSEVQALTSVTDRKRCSCARGRHNIHVMDH